jgi:hypothetical protein
MKAEHRHQLHTNILADRVGRLFQGMKSAPKSTSALVWVLVLLSFGTLAIWRYWSHASEANSSALWTEVDVATHDPRAGLRDLQNIGNQNPGTIPGRTADFELARLSLQNGLDTITEFKNDQAIDSIKRALRLYKTLAKQCADSPLLAQEALMGVAKAKESLIGVTPDEGEDDYGTLDQALEAYQNLASKYPKGLLGEEASRRMQKIEEQRPEIEKFYREQLRAGAKTPLLPKPPEIK